MSSFFERWRKSSVPLVHGWGPCYRKGAYRTREIADAYKAKSESRTKGLKLYVYECKVCDKFHLTKQKQAREPMMNPDEVRTKALQLCMSTGGRYLVCLHLLVLQHKAQLPKGFVYEVESDFAEYIRRTNAEKAEKVSEG